MYIKIKYCFWLGAVMKQSIQSFLDDLQIMPVCNSKCLADVLALAVEQPALLETHRLFYRYAVSNNLYTSTVTAMVKRALCSAQNTALMETLTGTDGWDVHPERFLFCAVESLTGRRPALRFQLRHAISEDDYDLLLHYKTHPQALSKQLGLQPKSLGSRYQRARETVQKALHAADAGASSAYLLYWYNLCPERIAVLRELLEKQWQFHDYTLLQEPQRSICRLMDNLHLRPTHRGHAYMVYALSLSLENPSLLQSGEVWQKTAAHYQIPVSQVTGTLGSFVQSSGPRGPLQSSLEYPAATPAITRNWRLRCIGISPAAASPFATIFPPPLWRRTFKYSKTCTPIPCPSLITPKQTAMILPACSIGLLLSAAPCLRCTTICGTPRICIFCIGTA